MPAKRGKSKKEEIIFETFGHVAIIKTTTPDDQSVMKIVITVDAKKTYDKKKKGKKWIS